MTSFLSEANPLGWTRTLRRRPEPVPACPCANGQREQHRLALCQAGFGRVTLGFRGLPYFTSTELGCTARHFPDETFAARLREALLAGTAIPAARWSEPKQPRCGRCGSRSWLGRRPRAEVAGSVALDPLAPFEAFAIAPSDQCTSCRLVQLIPTAEVIADLERALTRIFEAARFAR